MADQTGVDVAFRLGGAWGLDVVFQSTEQGGKAGASTHRDDAQVRFFCGQQRGVGNRCEDRWLHAQLNRSVSEERRSWLLTVRMKVDLLVERDHLRRAQNQPCASKQTDSSLFRMQ